MKKTTRILLTCVLALGACSKKTETPANTPANAPANAPAKTPEAGKPAPKPMPEEPAKK